MGVGRGEVERRVVELVLRVSVSFGVRGLGLEVRGVGLEVWGMVRGLGLGVWYLSAPAERSICTAPD